MSNTGLDPSELEDSYQGDNSVHNGDYFAASSFDTLTDVPKNMFTDTVSMTGESQDGFETIKPEKFDDKSDPHVYIDEDTRMSYASSLDIINNPRDIESPTEPDRGELSSPFSAMESDGTETGIDDASLSAGDGIIRRPTRYFGASTPLEYTTTPGTSACDENYESSGSRKKRRKTRRDMHSYYNTVRLNNGQQLHLPKSTNPSEHETWSHDADLSPFSPPTCPKNMVFNFEESSSRVSSGGLPAQPIPSECVHDKSTRSKTCDTTTRDITTVKTVVTSTGIVNNETPKMVNATSNRRRHTHHRTTASTTSTQAEPYLQRQYPKKFGQYELRILSQPGAQHRARYISEGSTGPVKDATTQGYPKIQLLGYGGNTLKLQVFVATDTGKVRPHGFYQACRVTGRNTSPCEEIEIDGTRVIEIPYKDDNNNMALNIDCVGIVKLRKTDVEVRTGVRNQKRNLNVRLLFRVAVFDPQQNAEVILQVASSRISCIQPLGQPEITKKSLDRCSVEGGIDMFIIGKNFQRGTKVVYQDPEQLDGQQWSSEGEVDKATFHTSHMVVKIPPYHDQDIVKPVYVQMYVEVQDKKCEPHSFTYMPKHREPPPIRKEVEKNQQTSENLDSSSSCIENVIKMKIPDGPIDRKFLDLYSKLIAGGIAAQNGPHEKEATEQVKTEPLVQPPAATSFALNNSQSFVNPAVVLPPSQPQSFLAHVPPVAQTVQVGTDNPKPAFSIENTGSTTIPVTNLQLVQPSSQIPINVNPVQLASFTNILGASSSSNIKTLPVDTNVHLLSENSNATEQVKTEPLVQTAAASFVLNNSQNFVNPAVVLPPSQAQSFLSHVPSLAQTAGTVEPKATVNVTNTGSTTTPVTNLQLVQSSSQIPVNVNPVQLASSANILGASSFANIKTFPVDTNVHLLSENSDATHRQTASDPLPTAVVMATLSNQSLTNQSLPIALVQPMSQATQPNASFVQNSQTAPSSSMKGLPDSKQNFDQGLQPTFINPVSKVITDLKNSTMIQEFDQNLQSENTNQQFILANDRQQSTLSSNNFGDVQSNLTQQTQQPAFNMPMQQFTVDRLQDSTPFSCIEPQILPQQAQLSFNKVPDIPFTVSGQQASTPFSDNEHQISQRQSQMNFNKSSDIQFTVGGQQAYMPFSSNEPQVTQQQTQLSVNKLPDVLFSDSKEQISMQQQPFQIMKVPQCENSSHSIQGQQKVQMCVETYPDVTAMQTSISEVQQQQQNSSFVNAPPTIPLVAMEKAQPMEDVIHNSSNVQPVANSSQSLIANNANMTQMFQASLTQQHTSPLQQTQTFPTSQTIQSVQDMITNQPPPQQKVVQQVYQRQEQHQQATIMTTTPSSHSVQMHSDFTVTNNVSMTPLINTPINLSLPLQQQTENHNIIPNAELVHSPDLFAMSQLLQSIDGSENLTTITEEDVNRQFH